MSFISPQWPAPRSIHALVSTRLGGVSKAPFDSLNLGDHVGDQDQAVSQNRAIFRKALPSEPIWLKQVHGTVVSTPKNRQTNLNGYLEADASVTNIPGEVLAIMTADCLPVLLTNTASTAVGAAHAGWRGLCAGVLENTAAELLKITEDKDPKSLIAWFGPAIGPDSFEVGEDVLTAFKDTGLPIPTNAFKAIPDKPGKFLADIYQIARARLETFGLQMIYGGQYCTVKDRERFFSYRRDGETGRFATAIWIEK